MKFYKYENQKSLQCCVSDTKSCITNNYPPTLPKEDKKILHI